MAAVAYLPETGGSSTLSDEELGRWRERIRASLNDRRRTMEPIWYEALAFAKGYHYVKYVGQNNRQLVTIPNPDNIERYTVDELTQYRLTLLGELSIEDERPQVLFRQSENPDEDYAEQANDALAYAWDEEVCADEALLEARTTLIDLGTAPVRCRFDPDFGPSLGEKPFVGGQLVSTEQAFAAHRQGIRVELRNVRQGRILWEPGTPFNVLVPPGFNRERNFPWEGWISVVDNAKLKERYGAKAADLTPDPIKSVATLAEPASPAGQSPDQQTSPNSQVKDQNFLYELYERPTSKHPDGRVIVLGGMQMLPLEVRPKLEYLGPDGGRRSGVHYLHAIRVTDRFWSRGFVELGMSPQRAINKRRTQIATTIDRGQPKVYLEEGSLKKLPTGRPMEAIELKPGKPKPVIDTGASVGPWMQADVEACREDLSRAIYPEVGLGDNPDNVQTYSQLALLKETAGRRLDGIQKHLKQIVCHLSEDTLYDIKRYWGSERQVQIAGDDGQLRAFTFNATQLPDYTRVEFAKGSKPRSQAAQLQLIEDMWQAALASRAVLMDPVSWLKWRKDSFDAGKMVDLPIPPTDVHQEKIAYENELLASGQLDPMPAVQMVDYFDPHEQHIVGHRQIQTHARLMGRDDLFIVIEKHIKEHERQAILNLQEQAAMRPPPPELPLGQQGSQPGSSPS